MTNQDYFHEFNIHVGKNIKHYRLAHNLTQQQLAERMGNYSQGMISQVENGSKAVSIKNLIEFANCLDISVYDLLSNNQSPEDTKVEVERITFKCYYVVFRSDEWSIQFANLHLSSHQGNTLHNASLMINSKCYEGIFCHINNYPIGFFVSPEDMTTYIIYPSVCNSQSIEESLCGLCVLCTYHSDGTTIYQWFLITTQSIPLNVLSSLFFEFDSNSEHNHTLVPYSYLSLPKSILSS